MSFPAFDDRYKKAHDSLSLWDGELNSPEDAVAVPYIGKQMVQRFESKLNENGIEYVKVSKPSQTSNDSNSSKPAKRPKKYIPTYRSGAYAILLALLEGDNDLMSKSEIIKYGQNYCDSSFTIPESNRSQYAYTAWNSIKILIQKDLVIKKGTKYALTESGQVLAQEIPGQSDDNNLSDFPLQESFVEKKKIPKLQTLSIGNYSIYLIVDNREIRGKTDRSYLSDELEKLGINLMTRSLDLGDFLWVARDNQTGVEIVLDYLVERKTMSDLVSSIKDGRFKEQKVYFLV